MDAGSWREQSGKKKSGKERGLDRRAKEEAGYEAFSRVRHYSMRAFELDEYCSLALRPLNGGGDLDMDGIPHGAVPVAWFRWVAWLLW